MIRFAIKTGLAASAVYYLSKEGVWKESTESLKVYDKLNETLRPYVKQVSSQIPIEVPALPETNKLSYVTQQYWNRGVLATFTFLSNSPTHVKSWSNNIYSSLMEHPEIKKMVDGLSAPPAKQEEPAKQEKK